jgi:hypothetical protein
LPRARAVHPVAAATGVRAVSNLLTANPTISACGLLARAPAQSGTSPRRLRRFRREIGRRIGAFWGHPGTRTLGEFLIDLEEDRTARAVVFGLLVEMERK